MDGRHAAVASDYALLAVHIGRNERVLLPAALGDVTVRPYITSEPQIFPVNTYALRSFCETAQSHVTPPDCMEAWGNQVRRIWHLAAEVAEQRPCHEPSHQSPGGVGHVSLTVACGFPI